MQDTYPTSVEQDEEFIEAAVMRALLVEHPNQLTRDELTRELGDSPVFVEDAVSRLARGGLVHSGEFVVPSRCARYMDRLEID